MIQPQHDRLIAHVKSNCGRVPLPPQSPARVPYKPHSFPCIEMSVYTSPKTSSDERYKSVPHYQPSHSSAAETGLKCTPTPCCSPSPEKACIIGAHKDCHIRTHSLKHLSDALDCRMQNDTSSNIFLDVLTDLSSAVSKNTRCPSLSSLSVKS